MRNHKVRYLIGALILLFLTIYISGCFRTVSAWYTPSQESVSPGYRLCFHGEQGTFKPRKYFLLSLMVSSSRVSSLPPGTAISIDGKAYPFSSLTTRTLDSLGFSLESRPSLEPDDPHPYEARLQSGSDSVWIYLEGNTALQLNYTNKSGPSSVGFHFGRSPEAKLPLSQEQMETIFGKPHHIELGPSALHRFFRALLRPIVFFQYALSGRC